MGAHWMRSFPQLSLSTEHQYRGEQSVAKDFHIRDMRDEHLNHVVALWREGGVSRPWNDPVTDIRSAVAGDHQASARWI